ncbi:MAG TPA: zinc finger domain-containing protein, partial [Candidatus Binataceae bacterium]
LKLLEVMRKAGTIGAPLEATLSLGTGKAAPNGLAEMLDRYREQLKDLFIVADVEILRDNEAAQLRSQAAGREDFTLDGTFARVSPSLTIAGRRAPGVKCQRCWTYFDDGGDPELCPRCRAVVRA